VTHPYDWYQFCQRLVHIIFSMGGYDEFLAGAFWFFRALLLSSIVFLVLYLLLHNRHRWLNHDTVPAVIAVLAVGFAWFKVVNHLSIVTVVQGGIRECWGVLFFALGVLYRRYEHRIREHWALTLVYAAILIVGASLGWQGMALKTELRTVATLPLTGTIGFLMVHHIASWLDRHELSTLHSSTQIIIAPGYSYQIVKMLITNFHQPQSTLLLLVSAFVHGDWHKIYDYALGHDFRFLSYGDSSLLIP
jgi:predicted PurR-regulated permease PerM